MVGRIVAKNLLYQGTENGNGLATIVPHFSVVAVLLSY